MLEKKDLDELIEKAKKIITAHGYKVGLAHCALECKPKVDWNKGRASFYILRKEFGVNWAQRLAVMFAGDDVTDEDAILALQVGLDSREFPFPNSWEFGKCLIPRNQTAFPGIPGTFLYYDF